MAGSLQRGDERVYIGRRLIRRWAVVIGYLDMVNKGIEDTQNPFPAASRLPGYAS